MSRYRHGVAAGLSRFFTSVSFIPVRHGRIKHFFKQRTNISVNARVISGPTVSTKTNKIGQSKPRGIIYINFVDLDSPMLHAKFQDHRTSASGEDF